ncbi:MFS transporter [bacterium]|nr:MFS transporter [bacterium]
MTASSHQSPASSRKVRRSWLLYDWANSAFATVILAALLPVWFADAVVPEGGVQWLGRTWSATSLWGYTSGLSALLVFLSAPMLGAMADLRGNRRRWLIACFIPGSLATVMLFTALPGRVAWTLGLYLVASIGFVSANIFYDAFLPLIAKAEERDRLSARGYAWGYLGGGIMLLIDLIIVQKHASFGLSAGLAVRIALASAGIWWGGFGLLAWRGLEEPEQEKTPVSQIVNTAMRRSLRTLRETFGTRDLLLFLAAFLLYNDGIQTVVKMASIFGAEEMELSRGTLMGTLLLVQIIGILGALIFGRLAGRMGARRAILLSLVMWTLLVSWAYFMHSAWEFWMLGAGVGLCLGGSQALSRSFFSSFIPEGRSAEYFGFYSIFAKFSAILGPILFAMINQATGSSRLSVLATAAFFVSGMILLSAVKDPKELTTGLQS